MPTVMLTRLTDASVEPNLPIEGGGRGRGTLKGTGGYGSILVMLSNKAMQALLNYFLIYPPMVNTPSHLHTFCFFPRRRGCLDEAGGSNALPPSSSSFPSSSSLSMEREEGSITRCEGEEGEEGGKKVR